MSGMPSRGGDLLDRTGDARLVAEPAAQVGHVRFDLRLGRLEGREGLGVNVSTLNYLNRAIETRCFT